MSDKSQTKIFAYDSTGRQCKLIYYDTKQSRGYEGMGEEGGVAEKLRIHYEVMAS
jgi:hypothetical protein